MKQTKRVLAVALALVMVLAMNIVAFAATPQGALSATKKDGQIVVTLSVNGDMQKFDYALGYDKEVVKVNSIDWEMGFVAGYLKVKGIMSEENMGDYVTLGGTGTGAMQYEGAVITVTFDYVGEVKDTDFTVVGDAAKLIDAGTIKADLAAAAAKVAVPAVDPTPTPGVETEAPATDVPATDAPATVAPTTAASTAPTAVATATATTAPTTAPTTTAPKTADTASVVIPVAAICAAAVAVVLASKKKVEE